MLLKISSSGQRYRNKCDDVTSFIEVQNVCVLELGTVSTVLVFFRKMNWITYLHHVPLFKLIKQFQPFNPKPQNSTQIRISSKNISEKKDKFSDIKYIKEAKGKVGIQGENHASFHRTKGFRALKGEVISFHYHHGIQVLLKSSKKISGSTKQRILLCFPPRK